MLRQARPGCNFFFFFFQGMSQEQGMRLLSCNYLNLGMTQGVTRGGGTVLGGEECSCPENSALGSSFPVIAQTSPHHPLGI